MVYLLTALAAKQAEKVHLQVKIVCLKKNIYILWFLLEDSSLEGFGPQVF